MSAAAGYTELEARLIALSSGDKRVMINQAEGQFGLRWRAWVFLRTAGMTWQQLVEYGEGATPSEALDNLRDQTSKMKDRGPDPVVPAKKSLDELGL